MDKFNKEAIQRYLQKLHERGESESTIKTKLRSIEKFIHWANKRGYLDDAQFKQIERELKFSSKLRLDTVFQTCLSVII